MPVPEGVEVRARRGGGALSRLITTLDRAGHVVEDVDVERASLEDAFVEVTRTGSGSSAASNGTAGDGDARAAGDGTPGRPGSTDGEVHGDRTGGDR
jgi:hypothetical protein